MKNSKTTPLYTYLLSCATLFALLWLASCSSSDDSTEIRNLIDQAADLAEKHQIGDLLRLTTADFAASPGSHDANSVKGILFMAFRHYGDFKILYPRSIVNVDAQQASTTVYFIIVRRDLSLPGLKDLYDDPAQWLEQVGETADPYRLTLDLIKEDRRWRVTKAHLEGSGPHLR